MLVATYNIQWGKGRDGRVDLDRIARTIESADIVGLQEVERFWREMDHADQAERLGALLPDRYTTFAASVDLDASSKHPDGTIRHRRRQYGLMVLSRWPILSRRSFPLPKYPVLGMLNDSSLLLETVIGRPDHPFRLYTTHLNWVSQRQRAMQVAEILRIVADAPAQGGAIVGFDAPDDDYACDWMTLRKDEMPPMPHPAILLGDFNMRPDSPEYAALAGPISPVYGRQIEPGCFADTLSLAGLAESEGVTFPAKGDYPASRLDHIFVGADLARQVRRAWIDEAAEGSDHQPVWAEIG